MKRFLLIGVIGVALMGFLCVGLFLGVMVTPARAQVGHAISQVLERANITFSNPKAVSAQSGSTAQTQTPPQLQLKDAKGVLIAGIFVSSPADKAGLVRGDIILDIDGQAVNTYADLRSVLSQHKVGDSLKLTIQHGDAQKSVSVTLAAAQKNGAANNDAQRQTPVPNQQNGKLSSLPFIGIVPAEVDEHGFQMRGGPGFGPQGRNNTSQTGSTIVEVASGSPAEKAGLKAGDVIVAVNDTAVDAQNTLQNLLANHKPGDSVKLTVASPSTTNGNGTNGSTSSQRDVTVTLGENPNAKGKAWLGVSVSNGGQSHNFPGMPGLPNNGGNGDNGNIPQLPEQMMHPGAVIIEVTAGGPAEKAGLKAGQFIQAVDGKDLTTTQDLVNIINSHKPGDTVTLTVFNPGNTSSSAEVKVTLGENPQKAGAAWLGIRFSYIDIQPGQLPDQPGQNLPQG